MLFSLTLLLIFSNSLFFIGLFGLFFLIKSNFFIIVSIETMLISINLNFLYHSIYLNLNTGIIFNFYIIIISAAEIVILLSFFIVYFKRINILDINESIFLLKN